jgi:hypothetical protein
MDETLIHWLTDAAVRATVMGARACAMGAAGMEAINEAHQLRGRLTPLRELAQDDPQVVSHYFIRC